MLVSFVSHVVEVTCSLPNGRARQVSSFVFKQRSTKLLRPFASDRRIVEESGEGGILRERNRERAMQDGLCLNKRAKCQESALVQTSLSCGGQGRIL